MRHKIPHSLPIEIARRATKAALDSYKAQMAEYNPKGHWLSEDRARVSFTVAGRTLDGAVTVTTASVDMELEVPFLFRPFKGVAMRIVQAEIELWLARAKAGEFDDE
jgi:hypothetical protein